MLQVAIIIKCKDVRTVAEIKGIVNTTTPFQPTHEAYMEELKENFNQFTLTQNLNVSLKNKTIIITGGI